MTHVSRLTTPADAGDAAIIARASALVPLLRSKIPETDKLGRLPEDVVAALQDAGMFSITVPRAYGGLEVGFQTYKEVIAELGRGDPSAAWAVNLIAVCNWCVAALFPQAVNDKIFGTEGGGRVCGVFSAITDKVKKIDGGLLIEQGRWPFNSGYYQANWDMVGVNMVNEEGDIYDQGLAIMPIESVTPLHDWDTIGLRGSGSTTITVKNVTVPDEFIFPFSRALQGESDSPFAAANPAYRAAFAPFAAAILVFPALGAARAGLELFRARLPGRAIQYTTYTDQSAAPVTHLQLGEASAMFDTAELLISKVLEELMDYGERNEVPAVPVRVRQRRDVGFASRLIWQGMDLLANGAGASVAASSALFNRFWRDTRVANLHGLINTEASYEMFGRVLAGLEPSSKMV